jgi:multiple sugar transport system substrate-binding protein
MPMFQGREPADDFMRKLSDTTKARPHGRLERRAGGRAAILLWLGLSVTLLPARSMADRRPVTLRIWIMQNAQAKSAESFQALVRPFTRGKDGVKIDVTVVPWAQSWDKIQNALAGRGGPAPDIVQLGTTWVAAVAATGKLHDLTGEYDEKLFPPEVLATTTIEDPTGGRPRRFAMPWIVDSRALYYNKAACAKAGVDPTKDFATWDSFKQALRKLKDVEVDGKRMRPFMVSRNNWDVVHTLAWWIWGWGGGFVPRAGHEGGLRSPGSVAGVDFAVGLVREGLMVHAPEKSNLRVIEVMLDRGEVATAVGYPVSSLAADRFGITLLPAGPKGRFTFLGGSTLAIPKSTRHREEALALVKYLSDVAVQFAYSNLTGLLPAAASEYDDLVLKLDPVRRVFVEQMRYGKSYPSIPQWGAIENVLRDGFNGLWDQVERPGPYDPAMVGDRLGEMAKSIDDALRGTKRLPR